MVKPSESSAGFFSNLHLSSLAKHIDPNPRKPPARKTERLCRGPAEIDQPLVLWMHLVVDLNDHRSFIAKIGNPHPGMHGQRITCSRQTVLAKDFIRKRLPALKLIRIVTRDAKLDLDRLTLSHPDDRQK
jgi:hypothetical protein